MSNPLPQDLREAGGQYRKQGAPGGSVDLDWLTRECERNERILRKQMEDGDLPDRHEAELRRPEMQLTSLTGGLKRWAYIKHLYRLWNEGRLSEEPRAGPGGKPGVGDEKTSDQMRAMVQLLERESVTVRLTHRTVEVTDRSYLALLRMAEHSTRVQELERKVERIDDARERIREKVDGPDDLTTRDVRRLEHLGRLRNAVRAEAQDHRRAIVANLTTEDGAPADSIDEAPDWADEIGPVDEVALIVGVRKAMSERISRLGEQPDHPRDTGAEKLEDWGMPAWVIGFRDFDDRTPVDPAAPMRRPLARMIAGDRAESSMVFESDYDEDGE